MNFERKSHIHKCSSRDDRSVNTAVQTSTENINTQQKNFLTRRIFAIQSQVKDEVSHNSQSDTRPKTMGNSTSYIMWAAGITLHYIKII